MALQNCCEDEVVGAYLGDGTAQQVYTERAVIMLFQRKYKDNGDINTLDLTQVDFGTYIKDKIQTTEPAESRLYPTGILDFVDMPDRSEFGSYTKTDESTVIVDSVGGIQSVTIGWDKNRAAFEKLRQLAKMECSQWQLHFVDTNTLLLGRKEVESATTMRGFDLNMQSFQRAFKFAQGTESSRVSASFELKRESNFDCAYGVQNCDHELTFDDLDPLHPANVIINTVTSVTEVIVTAEQALGKARDNKFFTGLLSANFLVTPKDGVAVVATSVAGVDDYTLTLAPALPALTEFTVEVINVANFGFKSVKGTTP